MKIAVMADIHSNHTALERCIAEAKQREAEEFIFLGDYLGELAYPERTLEILQALKEEYPCTFIRGNKEDYWIDHALGKHNDWEWKAGISGSGMLRYTYDRLTAEQIHAFEEMPITKLMKYEGMPDFVICHGSPFKVNESLREDYDYIDSLTRKLVTEVTVCGHFHIQSQYVRNGKRIINPGSVGVPLRSGGKTQFMMLYGNAGMWETEFITLDYDTDSAIREMDEENLSVQAPCWYRATRAVLQGRNVSQMAVLTEAYNLCVEIEGSADWRCIPEKYWQMALDEFGI